MRAPHFHHDHNTHHHELLDTLGYYFHSSLIPLIIFILILSKMVSGDILTIHTIDPESIKVVHYDVCE